MKQKFSLEEILNVIKAYIESHGYPPTNRELAKEFCCSLSTVNEYLRKMMNAGMLETDHPGRSQQSVSHRRNADGRYQGVRERCKAVR